MKVLALAGSLRKQSWNRMLMELGVTELKAVGVEVDVADLRALEIPHYDQDLDEPAPQPKGVAELKARCAAAQGFFIVSPEYNYSIPGVLKNALDWVSRPAAKCPLRGKVVLQAGATKGPGGTLQGQMHLRHVLGYGLGAWVMPSQYTLSGAPAAIDEATGAWKDENQKKLLQHVLLGFVQELKKRNPA